MTAYLDSSVVLRVLLSQEGALPEWDRILRPVASVLVEVECLRTLDRTRIRESLPDREIALCREAVYRIMESIEVVDMNRAILHRAAQPLPTPLGTLDAMHLATALTWRDSNGEDLILATHDQALAVAARALGLLVIGV